MKQKGDLLHALFCFCWLQEAQDPSSAELGLTLYQLATTYYANDMLADAGQALQRAATLIKAQYPPEHDLVGVDFAEACI